jgi:hypothetical protein
MRYPSVIACILTCLLAAQNLPAQSGNWNAVAAMTPGTHIYVVSKHLHRACDLLRVTDNELLCEEGSSRFGSRTLVAPRWEIREVREVQAREAKIAAAAALGAAVGVGIGRATIKGKDAETQVYGTASCALLGVIAGAVAGRIFSDIHSRIIYKR